MSSVGADSQGSNAHPALVSLRGPRLVSASSGHQGGVLAIQEVCDIVVHIDDLVQVLRGSEVTAG